MKHYFFGDYVISGIENAFNTKTSYWISKNGFTIALYCFTTNSKMELDYMLKHVNSYIQMFDNATKNK